MEKTGEVQIVQAARQRLLQHQRIDNKGDLLKRVERDTHRNDQVAHAVETEMQDVIGEEVGVFVVNQRCQLQSDQERHIPKSVALMIAEDPPQAAITSHRDHQEDDEGDPTDEEEKKPTEKKQT